MTEKTIKIRPYQESDSEQLLAILKANVPQYFAETEIADFMNYLASEIELYYVAEVNGEVVAGGGINFAEGNTVGRISWDFVTPELQGTGIGSTLLKYRLHVLHGMHAIQQISVRTSQLAYKFYARHGFELIDIKKDYWATGFDMYAMVYNPKYTSQITNNSVF